MDGGTSTSSPATERVLGFPECRFGNVHDKVFQPCVTTKVAGLVIGLSTRRLIKCGIIDTGRNALRLRPNEIGGENDGTFARGQCRPGPRH
jgi:hypothetical protein